MARSEARLKFSVWDGLDGHGPHAKLLYPVLLTEPTVNFAGVGAMRVTRWARKASLTTAETQKALDALVDSFHIVVDEDTEEVLVRTMIRNDEVWKQPFLLKGALQEALMTVSPRLRWVLAEELRKLPPKQPDGVSKSGKPIVYPDPHATADVLAPRGSEPPPETLSKGSRHPLDTLSTGSPVGLSTDSTLRKTAGRLKGSPEGLDTHSTDNGVGEGVGEGEKGSVGPNSPSPRKRGRRIPEDFAQTITPDLVAWARAEAPLVDHRRATTEFVDYWLAETGAKASKADWVRTWKNRLRALQERAEERQARRPLRAVSGGSPEEGWWEQ